MTAAQGVGEATLFPGYFSGSMPRNSSGVGLTQLQTKLSASPRIIQGNSSWREIKINGCSPKRNPSFSASLELLSSLIIPKKFQLCSSALSETFQNLASCGSFGHWDFFTPCWLWECFFHHRAFCPSCLSGYPVLSDPWGVGWARLPHKTVI